MSQTSLLTGQKFKICVSLLDGSSQDIEYDTATTVADAVKELAGKMKLSAYSSFTLFECHKIVAHSSPERINELYIALDDEKYIRDLKAEFTATKDSSKGQILECYLTFRKKIFLMSEESMTDPIFLKLWYIQLQHDYILGNYPVDKKVAAELSALKFLVEKESDVDLESCNDDWMNRFLPRQIAITRAQEEWKADILSLCDSMKNLTKEVLRQKFIQTLGSLLYGNSVFFRVHKIDDPIGLPGEVILGINKFGVHLFCANKKEYVCSFRFEDIKTVGNDATALDMDVRVEGRMHYFVFQTKQAKEIYVGLHTLIRDIRSYCTRVKALEESKNIVKQEIVTYILVVHYKKKLYKVGPIDDEEYSLVNLKTDFCKHVLGITEGVSIDQIEIQGLIPPDYDIHMGLTVDRDLFQLYGVLHLTSSKEMHVEITYNPSGGNGIPVPAPSFDDVLFEMSRSPLKFLMSPAKITKATENLSHLPESSSNQCTNLVGQSSQIFGQIPIQSSQTSTVAKSARARKYNQGGSSTGQAGVNTKGKAATKREARRKKLSYEDLDKELEDHETFSWSEDSGDEDWVAGNEVGEEDSSDSEDTDESESGEESDEDDGVMSDYDENEDNLRRCYSDDESQTAMGKFSDSLVGFAFKRTNEGKIKLEVNQTFEDIKQFRKIASEYAIQEGFELCRKKNEGTRVVYTCMAEGCTWRVYAAPLLDGLTFQIRTLNPDHTCTRVEKATEFSEATSTWIAEKYADLIQSCPDISIVQLAARLKNDTGIEFDSVRRFYRAKSKALKMNQGDHAPDYNRVYDYAHQVIVTNPGSIARISRIDTQLAGSLPVFDSFWMSFNAQKLAFIGGCRPFISVDGCHLKGPHGGVFLSAVTVDSNKGILPLAAMVCSSETKHTWGDFMRHLWEHIGMEDNRCYTFMSDRQKGVIDGIKMHFPYANHRYCALHIYANFKSRHPGIRLRGLYWRAVRATEVTVFNKVMDEIKATDAQAWDYLHKIPARHWSLHAFDTSVKCDHVTNNMSESFNAALGLYRGASMLTLFEQWRRMVMVRMSKRYEKCASWDSVVPPNVKKYFEDIWPAARRVTVLRSGGEEYEVEDWGKKLIVNLEKRSCDCRYWEISGLPCKHALACIKYSRRDPVLYCHSYMRTEAYIKMYSHVVHPIPDESKWEHVNHELVAPPKKYGKRGRKRTNRIRGADEPAPKSVNIGRKTGTKKCEKCKQFGHNKRTCGTLPKRELRSQAARAAAQVSTEADHGTSHNQSTGDHTSASHSGDVVNPAGSSANPAMRSGNDTSRANKQQRPHKVPLPQAYVDGTSFVGSVGTSSGTTEAQLSPTSKAIMNRIRAEKAELFPNSTFSVQHANVAGTGEWDELS